MVRVMVPVGKDESRSLQDAADFSSLVADNLTPFIPD
jgi:hypothetical protein